MIAGVEDRFLPAWLRSHEQTAKQHGQPRLAGFGVLINLRVHKCMLLGIREGRRKASVSACSVSE